MRVRGFAGETIRRIHRSSCFSERLELGTKELSCNKSGATFWPTARGAMRPGGANPVDKGNQAEEAEEEEEVCAGVSASGGTEEEECA